MSANIENHLCYFCDETFPYPSCFIANYNSVWICYHCEEFMLPINYNNQENDECCVCFENKPLIELPTCIHKLCFSCCKTIYFGSTTNERPTHWREMVIESPDWPFELDDDNDNDPERIKYDEYCDYKDKYFKYEVFSYDELIITRDVLIEYRPEWMNTEIFINYENKNFRYLTEYVKLEKEWDNYNESKTKGNKLCPLCRANPI
jgi:hypothetical protein